MRRWTFWEKTQMRMSWRMMRGLPERKPARPCIVCLWCTSTTITRFQVAGTSLLLSACIEKMVMCGIWICKSRHWVCLYVDKPVCKKQMASAQLHFKDLITYLAARKTKRTFSWFQGEAMDGLHSWFSNGSHDQNGFLGNVTVHYLLYLDKERSSQPT